MKGSKRKWKNTVPGVWNEWKKQLPEWLFNELYRAYLLIFRDPFGWEKGCEILDELYDKGLLSRELLRDIRYTFLKHKTWKWVFWGGLEKKARSPERFWWGGGLSPEHPWWKRRYQVQSQVNKFDFKLPERKKHRSLCMEVEFIPVVKPDGTFDVEILVNQP